MTRNKTLFLFSDNFFLNKPSSFLRVFGSFLKILYIAHNCYEVRHNHAMECLPRLNKQQMCLCKSSDELWTSLGQNLGTIFFKTLYQLNSSVSHTNRHLS